MPRATSCASESAAPADGGHRPAHWPSRAPAVSASRSEPPEQYSWMMRACHIRTPLRCFSPPGACSIVAAAPGAAPSGSASVPGSSMGTISKKKVCTTLGWRMDALMVASSEMAFRILASFLGLAGRFMILWATMTPFHWPRYTRAVAPVPRSSSGTTWCCPLPAFPMRREVMVPLSREDDQLPFFSSLLLPLEPCTLVSLLPPSMRLLSLEVKASSSSSPSSHAAARRRQWRAYNRPATPMRTATIPAQAPKAMVPTGTCPSALSVPAAGAEHGASTQVMSSPAEANSAAGAHWNALLWGAGGQSHFGLLLVV
mmetsp:Transcript_5147/g.13325  ORF Transcript_5147/g.13325 Transcript_5147/m.13325 type:complete len:314 (-) Transcript_5147:40-981(-)